MIKLKILLHSNIFLFILIVTVFAVCFFKLFIFKKLSVYDINQTQFYGKIVNYSIDENKLTMTIKAKEKLEAIYYIKDTNYNSFLKQNIKLGLMVFIQGHLKKPTNNTIPNTFNYKKYLEHNNIFYILSVENIKILNGNVSLFYNMKNNIIKRIESLKNSKYYKTFLLGDKSEIDSNMLERYKNMGIFHLFAISGMHINLFIFILNKLLCLLKIKIRRLYIYSFIIFYSYLSSFTASILRAALFYILLDLNKKFDLGLSSIKVLFFSVIILLMFKATLIFNIGFQYSAVATFGLLLGNKSINSKNYIIKVFMTSLVAAIFTFPISIYNFYEINILSIVFNILFVPLISFIIYPLSIISFIFPISNFVFNIAISFFEYISKFCDLFSIKIVFAKINIFEIIIYYLIIVLLFKYKNYFIRILLLLFIIFLKFKPLLIIDNYIYFLDVSQGDSILIQGKNNRNISLIDTGGIAQYRNKNTTYNDFISKQTITFIKSLGISNINNLILTHGDFDHMGEAINLVNNFKVEKVIFNCGEFNELETDLIKVLNKKKIPFYSCIKELNIDNNKLYFLQTKEYDNENDNSNVIYTEINEYKFMFMGDASIITEKEMLDKYSLPDIDVLKVGHHGSKTSSGKEFINEINPKYSVISVGKNNRYGHPNKEVLNNLKDSKIYRTDQNGSIMFKIKNNKLKIETCSP